MSMTILRKPVGVRGLKGLSKEPVMLRGFHVPPSRWKEKADPGGAAFSTPTKRYRFSRPLLVDDFDHEAIRRRIYHLYQAKEHVTLAKLFVVLKEDSLFHGQRSTLHILLKEISFK